MGPDTLLQTARTPDLCFHAISVPLCFWLQPTCVFVLGACVSLSKDPVMPIFLQMKSQRGCKSLSRVQLGEGTPSDWQAQWSLKMSMIKGQGRENRGLAIEGLCYIYYIYVTCVIGNVHDMDETGEGHLQKLQP